MGHSSNYSQRSLGGCLALIVEDDYFLGDELADAVVRTGARVSEPHHSVRQALNLVRSRRIDFAVVDINLSGWGAFQVAQALQSRHTPFVFATGSDLTMIPDEWRDIGLWERPFAPAALVSALPSTLGMAKPYREIFDAPQPMTAAEMPGALGVWATR